MVEYPEKKERMVDGMRVELEELQKRYGEYRKGGSYVWSSNSMSEKTPFEDLPSLLPKLILLSSGLSLSSLSKLCVPASKLDMN